MVEEQLAQQLRKSGFDVGAEAIPDKPTHGETLVEAVCTSTPILEVRFQRITEKMIWGKFETY